MVQWKVTSQLWEHMCEARDRIEKVIWREPRCGDSSIRHDNQTKFGALYQIVDIDYNYGNKIEELSFFMNTADHVIKNITLKFNLILDVEF